MSRPATVRFYFATEGNDDAAVARRLLEHVGYELADSPGALGGKPALDKKLPTYARSADTLPWFILRDLDHDAVCPAELVDNLIPNRPPLLVLRIAVRAIESWLLADDEGISDFLHVPRGKVPRDPERLDRPKIEMVNLARLSSLPAVRRDIIPDEGGGRPTGKAYTQRLVTFVSDHWDPIRARRRSAGIDSCISALERFSTTRVPK